MWKTTLGYVNGNTLANVKSKYRKRALKVHPNRNPGIGNGPFVQLSKALENAERYFAPHTGPRTPPPTAKQQANWRKEREMRERAEQAKWNALHAAEQAARNEERRYWATYGNNPPPRMYDPGSSNDRRKTPLSAHPLYSTLNNVEKKSMYARQYLNTLMGGNAKRIAHVKDQMQRDIEKIRVKINEERRRKRHMNELESRPLRRALDKVVNAAPYWWQKSASNVSALNRLNLSTQRRRRY